MLSSMKRQWLLVVRICDYMYTVFALNRTLHCGQAASDFKPNASQAKVNVDEIKISPLSRRKGRFLSSESFCEKKTLRSIS